MCAHTHTHTHTHTHLWPRILFVFVIFPFPRSLILPFPHSRAHLKTEVEILQNKLEKGNLAKSIAESKLSDFEREKKMIELDIQEILVRHKSDVTERMSKFARVSVCESHVICT